MSFIDDLRTRASQSLDNAVNNIGDYLDNRVTDAVVKVGEPNKGNQTAAQIKNGQYGAPDGVAGSHASPGSIANAQGASMFSPAIKSMLPLLAIGAAGAYFLLRKGKKGK